MTVELTSRDQMVRELTRTKKADLVTMALAVGRERGSRWVLGGPTVWSKDQLISYIVGERGGRGLVHADGGRS